MMIPISKNPRRPSDRRLPVFALLCCVLAVVLAAPAHAATNRGTGDSGDNSKGADDQKEFKTDDDDDPDDDSDTGDHKSGNCSVVYRMNVGGFQSEFGAGETNLIIKRLKPTPALFTPQSIEVESRMAQEVVQLKEAEESVDARNAEQALAAAEEDLQAAVDANDAAIEAEADAEAAKLQAEQDLADAEDALADNPDDPELQQAVEDAEAELAAAEV